MGEPARDLSSYFTYRNYRNWPEDERWELIGGEAWAMSAPNRAHQKLVGRLFNQVYNLLEGKPCEAYVAPFDILLPDADEPDDEVDTVVQPDVLVYCDRSRLTKAGARGAPDLAIEVVSPSTAPRDLNVKLRLYEKHGVREYWVVDPAPWSIWVWRLGEDGRFDRGELRASGGEEGTLASAVIEGLVVEPRELFTGLE